MKNLIIMFFVAMTFVFIACEGEKDEDKVSVTEEVKCNPACNENQECKLVEEKATCIDKVSETIKCDPVCDADKQECKLIEDKPACVNKESSEDTANPCKDKKENDDCGENKVCDKDLKCIDKIVQPEDAKPESKCNSACGDDEVCGCTETDPSVCTCNKKESEQKLEVKCDPTCSEDQECKCDADKCECVDKSETSNKSDDAECGEGKPECADGKECKEGKCEDKPAESVPAK